MRQLDLTERLLRLRGVPVLRGISTTDLAPLAASMRAATFEKGDVVLHEDQPPTSFYLLLTGGVTMLRRGNKLRTLEAPGGVGFLSVLARNGGGTEAIAESHTETFEVRADALHELFEDHFSVLLGTICWIADRLIQENIEQVPGPYIPSASAAFEQLIGDAELGIVERIFLLRRSPIFRNSNVNSIARLARRMKEVRVLAGETIWRPGDRADGSILIVKGMMEQRWGSGPSVEVLGPGYAVGGGEAISGHPRWNELVATEPSVFLRGSKEALIDMFEDDIDVGLQFMSSLANVLLRYWDRKAEMAAGLAPSPPSG